MASVFWDAEGILFIDYLEKGKTITEEYYSNLLTRLDEKNSSEKTWFAKEKNHLSSGQCTCPQKCFGNGKINPLKPELNPICYLLALLAHHFLHVSRIRVKSLTIRLLMSYIYGAPILDVSRSHTTQHSR